MGDQSVWQNTKTFFPLFLNYLEQQNKKNLTICIVGASDGRFVVPLAKKGYNVIAIENTPLMIDGGVADVGNEQKINILGLKKRLELHSVSSKVKIIKNNFLDLESNFLVDAIFTSSTWDCSINHKYPVSEYLGKMKNLLKKNGIFCSEYMMPCEEKHKNIEHFLSEGVINNYFDHNWQLLEEFYTPIFNDPPHIGKTIPHIHRMGFFLAKKIN